MSLRWVRAAMVQTLFCEGRAGCQIQTNERSETFDVIAAGALHGSFKKLAEAERWCEEQDWTVTTNEANRSNGLEVKPATATISTTAQGSKRERQHCHACNTDGEHVLHTEASHFQNDLYQCVTCNDVHERCEIKRRPSTIESNKVALGRAHAAAAVNVRDEPAGNPVVEVLNERVLATSPPRSAQPLHEIEKAPHYNFSKLEVIDVIEAWDLNFNTGNAIKYIARAPHKDHQLKDLKKARWYLEREISRIEALEAPIPGNTE